VQLEQLEYIVSISEHSSFSKAGQALHISQSAISQSITKLEIELGVRIFERSHTGVKPTKEGKQLIRTAYEALQKINEIKEQANLYKHSKQKHLNIGIVSGLHLPFLPKVLSQIKQEFPYLQITFSEKRSIDILDGILNKEIDIGIVAIYNETLKYQSLVSFRKWNEVQMFVFVNKASPFASYDYLTPEDLKDQTFVMYNGEYMMWFFSKMESLYGPFNLLFTSNNSETVSETIRNGLAIAIEIEYEVITNPYIKTGEIVAIPLKEVLTENNFLGLGKLKNNSLPLEAKKSVQYLEKEFAQIFSN
jgi:LysR family transcriptional regulator, transcription activator of glutamate synthase operon